MIKKIRYLKFLKLLPLILILFFAAKKRINSFDTVGKDISAYERAITDLFEGRNPYEWTIESFSNPDDPGNHGYAYLPGVLYLFGFLYVIALKLSIPFYYLWKLPVLLADIGVGLVLYSHLTKKKSYIAGLFAAVLWFYNPYNLIKRGYTYFDPIPIFLMLLSLIYLKKDSVKSGSLYALAIIFKTFPLVLLPLYLLLSKDKIKFLVSAAIIGIVFSLPFMTSISNFSTYLNGSIFVHNNRFIQGRPFLFYISYFYKIELFQIIPFKFYSLMSMFFGWILVPFLYYILKIKNKYILAMICSLNFYLFTPVLNRTYVLWFLPIIVLGIYYLFKNRRLYYYIVLSSMHGFYTWYLLQWKDGFHIWRP